LGWRHRTCVRAFAWRPACPSSRPGVTEAVSLRIARSLGRARDVVAELDRDALGRGRRISRPLAVAVLRRMGLDETAGDGDL